MSFVSYFINGINLGSMYTLIVLGCIMVYGITKMLNFAHGDTTMIGGFVVFTAVNGIGLPPVVGILLAVVICTVLGATAERVACKPPRMASSLAVLITVIGVGYLLQNLALLIFGANPKSSSSVVIALAIKLVDGQLTISGETVVTITTCAAVTIGLSLFIRKTKTRQATLAVSEDKGAAQLMGISINGTIALTLTIGSALAAIAGVLLCPAYLALSPYIGAMSGIKAFMVIVFSGIGPVPGAFIGELLLGVIESLNKVYISSQLPDVIVFGILILVLLVKPTGALGKRMNERV